MCLTKMTLKAFIFLSAFSIISCQTEMQEGRATMVKNVSPYTEEISTSIIEATEGVTQLAEAASENILEGTKELVENASSSLKEAGEKLAGEEEQKDLTSALSSDDGTLDLSQFSFEQQKIDRDEAAAFILEVREKRIIIQPGDIPDIIATVNIAAFARSTINPVGKRIYRRNYIRTGDELNNCSRFRIKDDAQRYFLANGGPELDPLKLDPDGDGYACFWNPEVFRLIELDD
tara:strand:- start:372 stop:1070 length:699 start_codon:yes stop_codon:yes gene_type:complete